MRSSLSLMFASLIWQLDSQQGILGANQSPTLLCARAKLKIHSGQLCTQPGLLSANQSTARTLLARA